MFPITIFITTACIKIRINQEEKQRTKKTEKMNSQRVNTAALKDSYLTEVVNNSCCNILTLMLKIFLPDMDENTGEKSDDI